MPTFREIMAEIIRQLSPGNDPKFESTANSKETFIRKYLAGEEERLQPDTLSSKSCYDLPIHAIAPLRPRVISAYTGPDGGLTRVNTAARAFGTAADLDVDFIDEDIDEPQSTSSSGMEGWSEPPPSMSSGSLDEIAGARDWNRPTDTAYGLATTLYEAHPVTKEKAGEPVADVFGVCVRENSAVLALADGVNWGHRACLAARCAVHGCLDYLGHSLFSPSAKIETTLDIFISLLRSFQAAHNLILKEDGLLTTLCVAAVCPLRKPTETGEEYVVCACNVGDSLAFVFSKDRGVWEITQGSHDIFSMRDMRDALGALGPVDGQNPELSNLTVSMTMVKPGDIVFLTSDGITDNFDPVVGKFALPKRSKPGEGRPPSLDLPVVEPKQRHELMLLRMEDLLRHGVQESDLPCHSARQLCERLLEFAFKLTMAKRHILEDPDLYPQTEDTAADQRSRRRRVGDKLAMVPGKLDHASVVAYQVCGNSIKIATSKF